MAGHWIQQPLSSLLKILENVPRWPHSKLIMYSKSILSSLFFFFLVPILLLCKDNQEKYRALFEGQALDCIMGEFGDTVTDSP